MVNPHPKNKSINKKLKLVSVLGLISLFVLFKAWISQTFIALLLGMLVAPPILVFVYVLKEGIPIIIRELESVFTSGKEFLLISISKESIVLEPESR